MINVCLIGLGRIGFDYDPSMESDTVLSHAKAVFKNSDFNLKYAVDTDQKKLDLVKSIFPDSTCLTDWKSLTAKNDIDLLVIALPTVLHYECLQDFSKSSSIKSIVLEKPAFSNIENFSLVSKELSDKIIVNYYRRFLPEVLNLSENIKNNKWGNPQKIICKYGKGFKHNASHLVDMIHYHFDSVVVEKSTKGFSINDFWENDPTVDINVEALINGKKAAIQFLGIDQRVCSVFSMEIFFEKALIVIEDDQIKIFDYIADPVYPDYIVLSSQAKSVKVSNEKALSFLYTYLQKFLKAKEKNMSSLDNEFKNVSFITSLV